MPSVITERLISTLRCAFPACAMNVVGEEELVFRAAHPAIGDLKIYLDDNEVTVMVANRHFHLGFNAAEATLPSNEEATDGLAARLVNDLRDIFENRMIFHIAELRFPETGRRVWWRRLVSAFRYKSCGWTGPL